MCLFLYFGDLFMKIFNRLFFSLLSLVFLLVLFSSFSFASSISSSPFYNPPESSTPFENNQYYSVIFDEEGEATVLAKLTFTNTENKQLQNTLLQIPKDAKILALVQEISPSNATRPTYYEMYTLNHYFQYKKITYSKEYSFENTNIAFSFPEAIKENEKGTILLYYKVNGYVQKDFNTYSFAFQTIKTPLDTTYIRASVHVEPELYLKDKKSSISYAGDNSFGMFASVAKMTSSDMSSLSSVSYNLEKNNNLQGVIKEAYTLDPYENLIVKGSYSSSFIALYFFTILEIIFFTGLGIFIAIFIFKKLSSSSRVFSSDTELSSSDVKLSSSESIFIQKKKLRDIIFASFFSALALLIVLGGGIIFMQNLSHMIGYKYREIIALITIIILFLASVCAVVLTPIYVGRKYQEFSAGMSTSIAIILWLVFFSVLIIFLLRTIFEPLDIVRAF